MTSIRTDGLPPPSRRYRARVCGERRRMGLRLTLVTVSVEKKWLTGWSAAVAIEGEFSDVTGSYAGRGRGTVYMVS
jgi:hypothetical protein